MALTYRHGPAEAREPRGDATRGYPVEVETNTHLKW